MHPYLSQNVFFLLIVTVLIFIHGPSSSSADEYSDCGTDFECGNIRVGYPFWGSDRPVYCGHPKLELNCTAGDVAVITISNDRYRVLGVNENSHTLTAVRTDYWDNVCPQTETDLSNTTLDSIVNYTAQGYQSLTLFYTCTSVLAIPSSNQFNCSSGSGGETTTNYFLAGDLTLSTNAPYTLMLTRSGTCQASVVLRISETQAETLQSQASEENLKTAINDGFELGWDAYNTLCDECQSNSSRRCGYNLTSGGFACFSNTQSQGSTATVASFSFPFCCQPPNVSLLFQFFFVCGPHGIKFFLSFLSVDRMPSKTNFNLIKCISWAPCYYYDFPLVFFVERPAVWRRPDNRISSSNVPRRRQIQIAIPCDSGVRFSWASTC